MNMLNEDECEAIFSAGGIHHPDHCDCTAYVVEQVFAEDDCCEGLLETFDAVERIIAARVAAAVAAERERTAGILQQFADTRGVNVGDVDDDWWRGYRQAQRECLHDAAELTARIARAGEEK